MSRRHPNRAVPQPAAQPSGRIYPIDERVSGAGGQAGLAPPPHAPQETTQPLDPSLVAQQRALARAHEGQINPASVPREMRDRLAAGTYIPPAPPPSQQIGPPPIASQPAAQPIATMTAAQPALQITTTPVTQPVTQPADPPEPSDDGLEPLTDAEIAAAVEAASGVHDIAPLEDPVEAEPLRGKPKPISDPGKAITGGFGIPGEPIGGSYHPLNGQELRTLIGAMLDELIAVVHKDLRLSIAATYPNVAVEVTLRIVSAATASDQPIIIKVTREEADAAGNVIEPADAIRVDLGLARPMKRIVTSRTGRRDFVDRTD